MLVDIKRLKTVLKFNLFLSSFPYIVCADIEVGLTDFPVFSQTRTCRRFHARRSPTTMNYCSASCYLLKYFLLLYSLFGIAVC